MDYINNNKKWVHFVGVGGAGMSAIANLALNKGYKVSGSDIKGSVIIDKLKQKGANISIGHYPNNVVRNVNQLVYSSCISKNNVEIVKAKRFSIPVYHRSEFLAYLMNEKYNIVVCGSHGKTTTSALIYHILYNSNFSVSAAVGGISYNSYENIESDTTYFVVEADESDGSFINFPPNCVVMTNIDKDHFDFYKDFDNMVKYFNKFLCGINKDGFLFFNKDLYKYKEKLFKNIKASMYSFGGKNADIEFSDVKLLKNNVSFKLTYNPYFENEEFKVNLPGIYNLKNTMAAIGVSVNLGAKLNDVKKSLLTFKGVRRRFQVRLDNNYKLIEDYAHHPTEIKAVIDTVRKCYSFNKIIGIFQPHRYTRTQLLSKELADALHLLDVLVLTDIYPANESPIPGISGRNIYEYSCSNGHKNVSYLDIKDITSYVIDLIEDEDLILVLGAGDIYKIADELEYKLKC